MVGKCFLLKKKITGFAYLFPVLTSVSRTTLNRLCLVRALLDLHRVNSRASTWSLGV